MYAKSTRPSAKREVQKERSAKRDVQKFRSAQRDDRVLRSATIESRALGALKLASEASCARRECARVAGRFFSINFALHSHHKIFI